MVNFIGATRTAPRSRYKLDTVDTVTDSEGSYNLVEAGTITYNDSGQHGSGYADYAADNNARHTQTGDFGGSANGAFTLCGWIYFNNFESGDQILTMEGDTNNHRIYVTVNAGGGMALGRRAKVGTGSSISVETISTGTWYFLAVGHDPANNQAFLWLDNTKYTQSDGGDYDFTEAGSQIWLGGYSQTDSSMDGRMSHVSMYLDRVFDANDITQMINYGELFDPWGPVSGTAIHRTGGFADYTRPSITAIKRFGFAEAVMSDPDNSITAIKRFAWDRKDLLTLTRIKRLVGGIIGKSSRTKIIEVWDEQLISNTTIFRGAYDDKQLTSGTTIVEFQDFDKPSETRIKVIDNLIDKTSDTFITLRSDYTRDSQTLIIHLIDIQQISQTRLVKTISPTLLSNSRLLKTDVKEPISNTRLKIFNQHYWRYSTSHISNRIDYPRDSQTAIKRLAYDMVDMASNVEIVRLTSVVLNSQTAIQYQQEFVKRSITTISNRIDNTLLSNTLIKGIYNIPIFSSIKIISESTTLKHLLSSTRIEVLEKASVPIASESRIVITPTPISLTSGTTIKGRRGKLTAIFRKIPSANPPVQ